VAKKRVARLIAALVTLAALAVAFLLWRRRADERDANELDARKRDAIGRVVPSTAHPLLLVTEPAVLSALERRGYSLDSLLGADGETNDRLVGARAFGDVVRTIEADLRELNARPGIGKATPGGVPLNRPFDASWLADHDARFELVGFVPRLDRSFVEAGTCGELRLVYRLALARAHRRPTRLPMTLSVHLVPHGDEAACASLARALLAVPERGSGRVAAIVALLDAHRADARRIEVNLQSLHGPATLRDVDDHAEYLLRSFDVVDGAARTRPLLNTPRDDLSAPDRDALREFVRRTFAEIDRGTVVVPSRFLATRAISVTPRGLARARNRPFAALLGDGAEKDFADLPYAGASLVKSPRALLRRLDEATCQGCHESRAVAGFHLLGEERDERAFDALAVGWSNHLAGELPWREASLRALSKAEPFAEPRPFAERARAGDGAWGERCGLGDPGFSAFSCASGLRCKDDVIDELGACAPAVANHEGDSCERAKLERVPGADDSPDGDRLVPEPRQACAVGGKVILRDACSPNGYGFPGGVCTDACDVVGDARGDTICVDVPAAGFEVDCFAPSAPLEACVASHSNRKRVRACDAAHSCRDDYACARVPGAPPGLGACVPPYFLFQARVDGPLPDR
jgi:hypothetical protein